MTQLPAQVPMPYPSSIFIREKAIIVNLESIRMLICENKVSCWLAPLPPGVLLLLTKNTSACSRHPCALPHAAY